MIGSGWEGRFGLGFMIAVGLVTSSWLVARTVERAKRSDQAVSVKGYAERKITSDFASWSGTFRAHAPQLVAAYEQLRREREAVVEWLAKAGVKREVVRLSAVTTSTSLRRDAHGHETSQIEAYHLAQEVSIEGTDVGLVERVSHGATDLIQNGVEIESGKPRFLYTRLNELKLQLLGEATKDARARAEQLAANGGGKVGALRSAEQGVFQITSAHSTEVSGSGEYDTESRDKVVKAVVTVRYLVE